MTTNTNPTPAAPIIVGGREYFACESVEPDREGQWLLSYLQTGGCECGFMNHAGEYDKNGYDFCTRDDHYWPSREAALAFARECAAKEAAAKPAESVKTAVRCYCFCLSYGIWATRKQYGGEGWCFTPDGGCCEGVLVLLGDGFGRLTVEEAMLRLTPEQQAKLRELFAANPVAEQPAADIRPAQRPDSEAVANVDELSGAAGLSSLRAKLAEVEKRIENQRKDLRRLHDQHDDMLSRLSAQGSLLIEYMDELETLRDKLAEALRERDQLQATFDQIAADLIEPGDNIEHAIALACLGKQTTVIGKARLKQLAEVESQLAAAQAENAELRRQLAERQGVEWVEGPPAEGVRRLCSVMDLPVFVTRDGEFMRADDGIAVCKADDVVCHWPNEFPPARFSATTTKGPTND